ncbi:MAG: glycosyltransferase [Candidatus Omnitrophota bacterium]
MKVFYVIPGSELGPVMIFVKRQVDSIEREGVKIARFFLRSRTSPYLLLKETFRLFKNIKEFKPDIIHAQYGSMTGFLCGLCFGPRFIITCRGSDINVVRGRNFLRPLLRVFLTNLAVVRADAVICVSDRLKNNLWWGKRRALVIPNGVNREIFRPFPKNEARKILGLCDKKKLILFNGNARRKIKRIDLAKETLKHVREKIADVELLVLDGMVDPDEVFLYHNAADCLLLTSDNEGSPNIVKEALACNLPIVSVDVGDVKKRLKGVFPSKIVSRDAAFLAEAVLEILLSGESSNGREMVESITETKIAKQIIEVYEKVIRSMFTVKP